MGTADPVHQLCGEERAFLEVLSTFIEKDVRPEARELEHADQYPAGLIEKMKDMGVFGLVVPRVYGGSEVSTRCFAAATAELSRGWMSLAGAMGSHSVVANLMTRFGTDEQRMRYLPRMATGEVRAAMALTEPQGGSDLQSIRTVANPTKTGEFTLTGTKTWITNAEHAQLIAVLAKTDPGASPPHRGMTILLVEKQEGVQVSKPLPKLGYKGIESCVVSFDDVVLSSESVLGGETGRGFPQMMSGLELGRIQVAARALGVARAALRDSIKYAQERETFGAPIWKHQAIGHYLAEMATDVQASQATIMAAADVYDDGGRSDFQAGIAKLFASEACQRVVLKAMRIHGSYGYSPEYDIERYYRDSPLMIIGEGTNEIQKNVIVKQLVEDSRDER